VRCADARPASSPSIATGPSPSRPASSASRTFAARALGCCKLTLETQERNHVAWGLYGRFGFAPGHFDPAAGAVLFRVKPL